MGTLWCGDGGSARFWGRESRGCRSSKWERTLRCTGNVDIVDGDCCRGRSKNDVAFNDDVPVDLTESTSELYAESLMRSISIRSNAKSRGLDIDFGDGDLSGLSDRIWFRSILGRIEPDPGVDAKWDRLP